MRILKLIGGLLALIGGTSLIIATLLYLQISTTLNVSWFVYAGMGLWAIMGGIWAILADIMHVKYSRGSGLLPLVGGILVLLFGLIYYFTLNFAFFPFSFFVIFGIPIESIFSLAGGLLILWTKDENK